MKVLAWLALPALLLGAALLQEAPEPPVVVFLLRHAEARPTTPSDQDPALTPEGEARAAALARLLGEAGVTHLFASELARTQATLAPLAAKLGLQAVVVPARDTADQVAALRALAPGSVAVVAGHSNTIPALARALGPEMGGLTAEPGRAAVLPHAAYDRIAEVILPSGSAAGAGAVRMIELRYGP
jgi:phosphohistidine phosphatase SixA